MNTRRSTNLGMIHARPHAVPFLASADNMVQDFRVRSFYSSLLVMVVKAVFTVMEAIIVQIRVQSSRPTPYARPCQCLLLKIHRLISTTSIKLKSRRREVDTQRILLYWPKPKLLMTEIGLKRLTQDIQKIKRRKLPSKSHCLKSDNSRRHSKQLEKSTRQGSRYLAYHQRWQLLSNL